MLCKNNKKKNNTIKVLPQKDVNRLKSAAKVISLEERLAALLKHEQEMKRAEIETQQMQEEFKKIDEARRQDLNAKSATAGESDSVQVIERAFLAKYEQEEEVRRVNSIIMNAKCHAVRDAQIQEKKDLGNKAKSDSLRLDNEVLQRAIQEMNVQDEKYTQEKSERLQYANDIKEQLREREKLRFLEAERIEEEAKMLRRSHKAQKDEFDRQTQLEREQRTRFRNELNKIAEMSMVFKRMLCEQEREAEMRVAAYQREREKRERQLRTEKKLAREAFERKQQRLYGLGQKILESKTQQEELSYLRQQEQIERAYRQREKAAVLRKQKLEKEIREARDSQMQESRHRQALQIARAEEDFNQMVDRLKSEDAKQKRIADERHRRSNCYRQDIIDQMNAKEFERRQLRDNGQIQSMAWRETERTRSKNIHAIVKAKLNAMREACLPEKYSKEVEMQLRKLKYLK